MTAPFSYDVLIAPKSTIGSIKWLANHSELDPVAILAEAEAMIYERLRAREMQVSATITPVANAAYVALPTGFLDPIELKMDGDSQELEFVHETLLGRTYNTDGTLDTGTPNKWAIFNEAIQFDVAWDATTIVTGRLLHYAIPAALGASNQTNFLTNRFPTLLRRAIMVFGYEARNRRDMMELEIPLVEQALDEANRSADRSRRTMTLRR